MMVMRRREKEGNGEDDEEKCRIKVSIKYLCCLLPAPCFVICKRWKLFAMRGRANPLLSRGVFGLAFGLACLIGQCSKFLLFRVEVNAPLVLVIDHLNEEAGKKKGTHKKAKKKSWNKDTKKAGHAEQEWPLLLILISLPCLSWALILPQLFLGSSSPHQHAAVLSASPARSRRHSICLFLTGSLSNYAYWYDGLLHVGQRVTAVLGCVYHQRQKQKLMRNWKGPREQNKKKTKKGRREWTNQDEQMSVSVRSSRNQVHEKKNGGRKNRKSKKEKKKTERKGRWRKASTEGHTQWMMWRTERPFLRIAVFFVRKPFFITFLSDPTSDNSSKILSF